MKSEYEIAVEHNNLIVTVGCIGLCCKGIMDNLSSIYTNIDKDMINALKIWTVDLLK